GKAEFGGPRGLRARVPPRARAGPPRHRGADPVGRVTQKITRAMKLVAAAKLRRAHERILAARPYAGKMAELLGNLVSSADADEAPHPLLIQRAGPRRQIVIITADRGLAGAFNSNIIRRALDFIRQSSAPDVTLVVVGKKCRDFFRRRGFTIKRDMLGFWDRLAYGHAAELADF